MSPKKRNEAIRAGARQAAAQLKPAAERAKPLAKSTSEAARRQIRKTRAWAAPRVRRSGQSLQDKVAPKVATMLSSAAKRIDPAQPRQRQWTRPAGLATVTAVGGAVAAFLRGRRKPAVTASRKADSMKTDSMKTDSMKTDSSKADSIQPSGNGQGNDLDSETRMNSEA
jgi:hypothetical protein